MHDGFGFFGFFHFIWSLFWLFAFIWVIRFFARGMKHGRGWGGSWGGDGRQWGKRMWREFGQGMDGQDEAMATARERLAKSEITPEQFETIKKSLETKKPAPEHDHDWKGNWNNMSKGDNALNVARMRLAKGEISSEEYEMIRRTLEN
jgi:uncharacterized membrane protein